MQNRTLAFLVIFVLVTTLIWVLLIIVGQVTTIPAITLAERVQRIESQTTLFVLGYLNAALITLTNAAMLAGLCAYFARQNPVWVAVALVFVPVYAFGNLLVYLSQVFVVPNLIRLYHDPQTLALAELLLGMAIHEWTGSITAFVNALSYAVLGISSLILGVIMMRGAASLRIGGLLLAASGLLSVIALIGVEVGSDPLSGMTVVSGVVYLVSLFPIGYFFLKQAAGEENGVVASRPSPV